MTAWSAEDEQALNGRSRTGPPTRPAVPSVDFIELPGSARPLDKILDGLRELADAVVGQAVASTRAPALPPGTSTDSVPVRGGFGLAAALAAQSAPKVAGAVAGAAGRAVLTRNVGKLRLSMFTPDDLRTLWDIELSRALATMEGRTGDPLWLVAEVVPGTVLTQPPWWRFWGRHQPVAWWSVLDAHGEVRASGISGG